MTTDITDNDHISLIDRADRVVCDRNALEETGLRIAELEAALHLFVKQWNACGPNSDFGRYFSNVRDAANAALSQAVR